MNHPPGSGVAPLLQIIFLPIDERREDPYMIETRRKNLPGGVRELKLPLRIIAARPAPIIRTDRVNNFPCFVRAVSLRRAVSRFRPLLALFPRVRQTCLFAAHPSSSLFRGPPFSTSSLEPLFQPGNIEPRG